MYISPSSTTKQQNNECLKINFVQNNQLNKYILINQSILKTVLIINCTCTCTMCTCMSVISIIPKDILLHVHVDAIFNHVTANNVQCGSDHQMGGVSCINWPNYLPLSFMTLVLKSALSLGIPANWITT